MKEQDVSQGLHLHELPVGSPAVASILIFRDAVDDSRVLVHYPGRRLSPLLFSPRPP